jgi:hypothetical protein
MKLFRLFVLFLFPLLTNCSTSELENIKIIAEWNAHKSEEYLCDNCDTNDVNCCVLIYSGERFIRSTSFILKTDGSVDSVYSYRNPMGVNIDALTIYRQLYKSLEPDGKNWNHQVLWSNVSKSLKVDGKQIEQFELDIDNSYLVVRNESSLTLYQFE